MEEPSPPVRRDFKERTGVTLRELEYPFDSEWILKKSKSIRKTLLSDGIVRIPKRIAVLGGSTTHDIVRILDLFLLHNLKAAFRQNVNLCYVQYSQLQSDSFQ